MINVVFIREMGPNIEWKYHEALLQSIMFGSLYVFFVR